MAVPVLKSDERMNSRPPLCIQITSPVSVPRFPWPATDDANPRGNYSHNKSRATSASVDLEHFRRVLGIANGLYGELQLVWSRKTPFFLFPVPFRPIVSFRGFLGCLRLAGESSVFRYSISLVCVHVVFVRTVWDIIEIMSRCTLSYILEIHQNHKYIFAYRINVILKLKMII